jgi:hypothetical protein
MRGLLVALREAPRRDRLPHHHADAEEIGASVDRIARGLLRRDVGELALEHAALRRARRARGLRDAEVDQLHLPVVGDERVLGAHVAVHDVQRRAVEIGQRVRVLEAERAMSARMRTWTSSGMRARVALRSSAWSGCPSR